MELVLIALGASAVAVLAARRPAHPTPVDPYTAWMVSNLPRLRSWRR